MGWKDDLLDASFRGLKFDTNATSDKGAKALAIFEYPNVNGADVLDMGNKALQLHFKAIFFGTDYKARLDDFQDALEQTGPGTLVHPIFGSMEIQVVDWTFDAIEDEVDCMRVHVSFMEKGIYRPVFLAAPVDKADKITAAAGLLQLSSVAALQGQIAGALNGGLPSLSALGGLSLSSLGLPNITGLRAACNIGLSQVQAALSFTSLKALVSDLDPILHPTAWANDLFSTIERSFQALPFGGLNALFDSDSGATVVVAGSSGSTQINVQNTQINVDAALGLSTQPQQLTDFYAVQVALAPINQLLPFAPGPTSGQGLPVGLGGGSAGAGGSPDSLGGGNAGAGTRGGYGYAGGATSGIVSGGTAGARRTSTVQAAPVIEGLRPADRAFVQAFIWTACSSSMAQAAAIVLADEPAQRALQPADIERVAGLARDALQVAVLQVRATYAPDAAAPVVAQLKAQALAVQDLALDAIRLRPPVVTRRAPIAGHLRLLAHNLYGDQTRAPELARLNSWGRTPLVHVGQEVSVYAQ